VLFTGFGNAFGSVSHPVVSRALYGNREYATAVGFFMAANNLGSAIGPTLCGTVYETMGSYRPAFFVFIFATAVIALVMHIAVTFEAKKNLSQQKG